MELTQAQLDRLTSLRVDQYTDEDTENLNELWLSNHDCQAPDGCWVCSAYVSVFGHPEEDYGEDR